MKRDTLQKKIDEKGEAYRASTNIVEREKLSTEIRELTVQLQDTLSEGANACPDGADHRVIGMLKTPTHWNHIYQMQMPDLYEVGCLTCPAVLVEREGGTVVERAGGKKLKVERDIDGKMKEVEVIGFRLKRWSHSARGTTPEEAVQNWNSGKWLEDAKLDSVASTKIFQS